MRFIESNYPLITPSDNDLILLCLATDQTLRSTTVAALASSGILGSVGGPASATDGTVALFDGATGKLIKDSLVSVGATGNLTATTLTATGNPQLTPVTSIADLRALSVSSLPTNTSVVLLGYYAAGDGGGGLFYYDSTSVATDDGGTIIQPTVGAGRWLRSFSGMLNVQWFGAKGDGATDDTAAIQAAITVASTAGGGIIYFPNTATNIYYLGTGYAGTVNLPVLTNTGTSFEAVSTVFAYHFYLQNVVGLSFVGTGVTIQSGDSTSGGQMFIFDGCRDIVWDGITLQSTLTFDSGTGVITTGSMGALAFTSTTQDSERIYVRNYKAVQCYSAFYIFGDGAGAYRVRNVTLDNVLGFQCEYVVACHDNGDLITFNNVRASSINARCYFVYGVDGHRGQFETDGAYAGLFEKFLIKAYDRDTTNLDVKFKANQVSNGIVTQLLLQSQHYTATQPVPARVRNIRVNMDDTGNTGASILFSYVTGTSTVPGTSSANLFDNVVLQGHVEDGSSVTTDVVQANGVMGYLNIQDLIPVGGVIGILDGHGFYSTLKVAYAPILAIGGSSAGITYSTNLGEFFQIGSMVYGTAHIVLTSIGGLTGAVTVTLPKTVGSYTTNSPILTGAGIVNVSGLSGPLVGLCQPASAVAPLFVQGATGVTALTDTNLANNSELILTFAFPK